MSWTRGRKGTIASIGVLTVGAVALTTFAVAYDGNPTAEVELDDGAVWVTKTSAEVIGHLGTESALLDGQLRGAESDQVRVLQTGPHVFVHDAGNNSLSRVDGAAMVLGERVMVDAGSSVQQGGETLAILEPEDGALFVMPAAEMGSFSVEESEPTLEVPSDAVVTVGVDGAVHVASASQRTITTIETTRDGSPADEPVERQIENVADGDALQITSVGRVPVVLNAAEGLVITPDGLATSVGTGEGMRLADDAESGSAVRVATSSALLTVPLDGSEAASVAAGGEGEATTPVVVDGCAYAAWRGANLFVRDCPGTDRDLATPLPDAAGDASLTLRARGTAVVVNDGVGGRSWLASDELQIVDNWDDLTPPEGDDQESEEVEQTDATEVQPPDRTQDNRPPEAGDDEYGVRAGRSAVLPVLDNDNDPDGDLLTVTVSEQPAIGTVEPIQDGKALQITVPPNEATGTGTFSYTVEDGRGGSDTGRVTFSVQSDEQNQAPVQKPLQPTVAVETGGSVTYNVLPDWIDPDGDDIFLAGVTPAEGDEVTFTADGQVTYHARSGQEGPIEVDVSISDGRAEATGSLALDVRPVGTVRPVTNADHAVLYEGETATVEPLVNDINAASEELTLSAVSEIPELGLQVDHQNGTFEVTSDEAGTYYLEYTAVAGPQSAPGLVRVDVLPQENTSDDPPVAVRDTAYLPGGGEVLVDVLQNDQDPSGGVLVVQSVSAPDGSGVSAAVLAHQTVRITDRAMLSEQVVVSYTIHNGRKSASGEIVVIPVPPSDTIQPPVAEDDSATVRAGDIVTIPVTDNDHHPNGDTFQVVPEFVEAPDEEQGQIFVSQDTVRFRAAEGASGQATAIYEIVDSQGQKSAGLIRIDITPWNEESNSAPNARSVTARAIAGSSSRVEIPLEGIDPDGDMVDLVGISSAPSKGRITEIGPDFFTFEAYRDASGVDAFRYRVVDTFGEEAIGTVRIGIAPPEGTNQPPNAMTDEIAMRPGRTVSVPVLANDSDPEGDTFGLVSDGIALPDGSDLRVEVSGDRIVVTAPQNPTQTQFEYAIRDEVGNEARGVVHVTVAEDVPLESPIARDDRVLIDMVTGDFTADIDLFENDEDPDGTTDALELAVDRVEPLPAKGPGWVRVAIDDRRQTIPYTVTDIDGNEASAFLIVPAKDDLRPVAKEGAAIEVQSNKVVEIPLADYVQVADGLDVRITSSDRVSVNHGDGSALVKDPTTLQYRSEYRYMGSDDITFEVTDGDGPDDPDGRKSVITLPITVTTPENEPPEFTNTTTTVGAGDGPVTIDLAQRTFDIDEDPISYTATSTLPDGVTAEVSGSTLTVEATPEARGRNATVELAVSDGENDPVSGQVGITVSASGRPLPGAVDDALGEVHQGEQLDVAVLGNDFNPFEGDGPLRVIDARVEAGDASVSYTDDSVSVTPGGSFHGYLTVRYTIADLTDDSDRYVQGRITATVLGVPDRPGTPRASEVGNRQATLSWTAPSNNGAEIGEYLVEDTLGSGYSQECRSTVCRLEGLVNNREYQFVVSAINEVGPSPASATSAVVRPDVKPEAPAAPRYSLAKGERDQRLGIAWNKPRSEGSPVTGHYLRMQGGGEEKVIDLTGRAATSYIRNELVNGTKYRFQVAAVNRADVRSIDDWAWSPWSAWEYPATVPDKPGVPSVTRERSSIGENIFTLALPERVSNGGAKIEKWAVQVHHRGGVAETITQVADGRTEIRFALKTSTEDYRFSLAALNREGRGAYSDQTKGIRSYSEPGPVSEVRAAGADGALHLSWAPAEGNGARDEELGYQYRLSGPSSTWRDVPKIGRDGDRLTTTIPAVNGQDYTVAVRAYSQMGGEGRLPGEAGSTPDSVRPFGPLPDPVIQWTFRGGDLDLRVVQETNGYPLRALTVYIEGRDGRLLYDRRWDGNRQRYDETTTIPLPPGERVRIKVYARDTAPVDDGQKSSGIQGDVPVPEPSFELKVGSKDRPVLDYANVTPGTYELTCSYKNNLFWSTDRGTAEMSGSGTLESLPCFDKAKAGSTIELEVRSQWDNGTGRELVPGDSGDAGKIKLPPPPSE
ncbi:Ig-like domain-containing protein [Microbacterium sp. gxy059]|uniref:Ig-like domain-containing protein n=1 Tax=Microbacterium sp. gxy059 TaxID=2957199 RepID=UPI003D999CD3